MRATDILKNDLFIILIIIIFAFSVRYVSLMDQGVTWDEPIYVQAGIQYIHNIEHLDFNSGDWVSNFEHPTFSKYLYGAVIVLFNNGTYDYQAFVVCKILSAIMGTLTCVLVYLIGREFFDRRIGATAAIILALIPVFVAHNQQAAIDTPIALIFTITMFLFMLAVKKHDVKYYFASAISTGVLVDTKFNGLLILPVMGLFYLLNRYIQWCQGEKIDVKNIIRTVAYAFCFLFIAGLTLYALWPWIWNSPTDLSLTLQHWDTTPYEYFLGTLQGPTPIYYPAYFLATTPTLLLIPLFIGVYSFARSRDLYKYGIILWCFIPFFYGFYHMVQGGMRYILMIYPAVAILCAAGLVEIAVWVSGLKIREDVRKAAFPALVALTIVYLIFSLASVYPYDLDYYNALSGGPANVYKHNLFSFGGWGEGISDSIMYIEHNAAPESIVYMKTEPSNAVGLYGNNCTYIVAYDVEFGNEADYVVVNNVYEVVGKVGFKRSDYTLVHETLVQGAPVAKVYRNKKINDT